MRYLRVGVQEPLQFLRKPMLGEAFQFIRDQNTKKTLASITQLSGKNTLGQKNTLDWALGYNYLGADEPNRIRNEVNFNFAEDPNTGTARKKRRVSTT